MTWQNPYNQMQHNVEAHHVGTWQTRYPQSHGRGAGFPQRHGTGNSGHELSNNPHTGRSVIVGASPGGFMAAPHAAMPAQSAATPTQAATLDDRLLAMVRPEHRAAVASCLRGETGPMPPGSVFRGRLQFLVYLMGSWGDFINPTIPPRRFGFASQDDWRHMMAYSMYHAYAGK